MRYIQTLPSSAAVQTALDSDELGKPYVCFLEDAGALDWNEMDTYWETMRKTPITLNIVSASTLTFTRHGSSLFGYIGARTIQYSINGGDWTDWTSSTGGTSINVAPGDQVRLRGDNSSYSSSDTLSGTKYNGIRVNGTFTLFGNILSLINSTDFYSLTTISATLFISYSFMKFFEGNTGLTEADISFGGFSFNSNEPYPYVFQELFLDCSNLSTVKTINTIGDEYNGSYAYFKGWLTNVSPTGTFVKHPDATWSSGDSGIPTNWTVQNATL